MCTSLHVCTDLSLKKLMTDVCVSVFPCECVFELKSSYIYFAGMNVCAVQCVGQSAVCVSV